MNTTEMKAQIRTFVVFLIIGLILGNLVSRSLYLMVLDWLALNELPTILLPIIQGAILYAIVGLSIGLALRRGIKNFQENEMFILAAGWGVGGAIERGAISYIFEWRITSGLQSVLPFLFTDFFMTLVLSIICALSISTALQRSLDHITREQRSAIISNWLLGWIISWVIYILYYSFVLPRIALFVHTYFISTTLGFAVIYGLASGLIGGRAIYAAIYQIEPISDPEKSRDLEKQHSIMAIVIGAVTASIGGALKSYSANYILQLPGIPLPLFLYLLTPIIGGLLAWVGFGITNQIENNFIRILSCGLAGGILTTLIFLSMPFIAQ